MSVFESENLKISIPEPSKSVEQCFSVFAVSGHEIILVSVNTAYFVSLIINIDPPEIQYGVYCCRDNGSRAH